MSRITATTVGSGPSALRKGALLGVVVFLAAVSAGGSSATAARHKAIWGPLESEGVSQFPTYKSLGVGIYQMSINWATVAPTRPADPTNPSDPAYLWPAEVDQAIAAAQPNRIRVSILLSGAPAWANGDRASIWAPEQPPDFADFAAAASRRYPAVRHWMIWGEPSKPDRFQPLIEARGRRLSRGQRKGPRLYARILDASYAALKRVNRRNLVVGGNTWTAGEVVPLNFIRAMRLPSGRRPRMDLYGHNPFTSRQPDLRESPLAFGTADMSDLDTLTRWLDGHGFRDRRGRRLRLFLSEFSLPTDHPNFEFPIHLSWRTQARWLAAALRIARRDERVYTLGYLGLYDDPPRSDGLEVNRGLITHDGQKKPAYYAFRDG
jgi:hypothetical protein